MVAVVKVQTLGTLTVREGNYKYEKGGEQNEPCGLGLELEVLV